jgi:hypothetical protein
LNIRVHTRIFNPLYAVAVAYVLYVGELRTILRSMRMHPYRACIFLKIHTYVENYAKIRIKCGKILQNGTECPIFEETSGQKPFFIYDGEKAYAEGLFNKTAYSECMYIHTPTAYDRTTQPYVQFVPTLLAGTMLHRQGAADCLKAY